MSIYTFLSGNEKRRQEKAERLVKFFMGPQPTHRAFAVVDLRGEDGFMAHAVFDAGHGKAVIDQPQHVARLAATRTPTSAVDVNDQRWRGRPAFRHVQIEQQLHAIRLGEDVIDRWGIDGLVLRSLGTGLDGTAHKEQAGQPEQSHPLSLYGAAPDVSRSFSDPEPALPPACA